MQVKQLPADDQIAAILAGFQPDDPARILELSTGQVVAIQPEGVGDYEELPPLTRAFAEKVTHIWEQSNDLEREQFIDYNEM